MRAIAVRAAPTWKDGSRRVRYINPITGGSTMPLMDCFLTQIDKGTEDGALPHHRQYGVPGLRGPRYHSKVGEDTIAWEKERRLQACRTATGSPTRADETSTLFLVTDRDALRRLDLLSEQYGNIAA